MIDLDAYTLESHSTAADGTIFVQLRGANNDEIHRKSFLPGQWEPAQQFLPPEDLAAIWTPDVIAQWQQRQHLLTSNPFTPPSGVILP